MASEAPAQTGEHAAPARWSQCMFAPRRGAEVHQVRSLRVGLPRLDDVHRGVRLTAPQRPAEPRRDGSVRRVADGKQLRHRRTLDTVQVPCQGRFGMAFVESSSLFQVRIETVRRSAPRMALNGRGTIWSG